MVPCQLDRVYTSAIAWFRPRSHPEMGEKYMATPKKIEKETDKKFQKLVFAYVKVITIFKFIYQNLNINNIVLFLFAYLYLTSLDKFPFHDISYYFIFV